MSKQWWTDEAELRAGADRPSQVSSPPPAILNAALKSWANGHVRRPLSYVGGSWKDPAAWRETARAFIIEQLFWPTQRAVPSAELLSRREHPDFIEEQIIFTTAAATRVPATVTIPRHGAGPFPAIVALHEMGGFRLFGREKMLAFDGEPACLTQMRQACYHGRSILAELAKRGYISICIDAMNFGERTEDATENPESFSKWRLGATVDDARAFALRVAYEQEHMHVQQVMSTGRTWPGLIISDDQHTIDYLLTRPDVDPKRIGCLGLSFGAYRANYLAALDERIRAAVTICWTSTLDAVVGFNRYALNWFASPPGMLANMDIPDLLALAAPRALMVLSGWRDGLMRPHGITAAHLYLRECFEKSGCPEQLASLVFDAPHEFNPVMQGIAFDWLDEKLKS